MSTSITLTWTEIDVSERNGVITSYIVQYEEGTNRNITINTQSNATTRLITGLKPFTQYTFTVGVNSVGIGPFSSINITTAEKCKSIEKCNTEADKMNYFSMLYLYNVN